MGAHNSGTDQLLLLVQQLETGQWDVAEQQLRHRFARLEEHAADMDAQYVELFHLCGLALGLAARQRGLDLMTIWGGDLEAWRPPASPKQLEEKVMAALSKLKTVSVQETNSDIVQNVRRLVQQRLYEDLSLKQLSESVHLHPKYLSWLYKQQTGEGLSEYVYRVKMEKAAEWLIETRMKVYEIARRLGYRNPSYFIRVFKEKYRMTPSQFRARYALGHSTG